MEAIEQASKLPEVRARIYAEAFGFSIHTVNSMCSCGSIPCRKIGKPVSGGNRDNRAWMVNMIEIRKELEKTGGESE
ncbi:hypothetical protein [Bathymodiolus septemdierum thioautotrophic gill symbiont]|uniref:Uncharacterized protein n=1 Tax=endosymbiont of Bathymodiolus septemdierum str. Myojin knoll TaxID=1303921 RepID=A0A0P0UQX6_9GAMM|nr:hypothetical protein [Bathymodiolus septemdierum thioautotrophic gill symbiont]BAS67608.1 hypothetical protein BSEPE_0601 [endosymbiont of Bathymodiolus septemdierum str. Myojin knoll]